MSQPSFLHRRTALAVAVLALLPLLPQEAAAADKLTLRVNDARGGPGDLVAVVVRTYASRPIGQGQIRLGTRRGRPGKATAASIANVVGIAGEAAASSPFARLEKVEVFSSKQDARFQFKFDGREADVVFRSPSGSINAVDGPLAVFHFRLSNSVKDGEVYAIDLDIADSLIVAGSGQRIAIESKPGELEIREDDDGDEEIELAATGGRVRRGKVARVKLGTEDRVGLSSGRIALRYDAKIASGKPWVRVDPRHGKATVLVNTDTPGLVVIDFQSPDRSLNRVPGDLFEVRMTISRQAPRGRSPVTIDRGMTLLRDEDGDRLDLEIRNGVLTVR